VKFRSSSVPPSSLVLGRCTRAAAGALVERDVVDHADGGDAGQRAQRSMK
jgi:hypothetical protein